MDKHLVFEDEPKHRALAEKRRTPCTNTEIKFEFDGFALVVRGDYQPAEPQFIDYVNGGGEPGCPENFEVTEVYLRDSAIEASELFDCCALGYAVLEEMAERAKDDAAEARADACEAWEKAA